MKTNSYMDAYKKIRKEWGINPTTKIIPDKKKYKRKAKHKENFSEWL